ncbi:nuclear protein UL24 [Pteropodid alphaherpesvirus 1]|uniref:Nuclear protein UL24 n=1 Tax=Pteropodid alphaherpesvirus 1 TaxID=1343901 RepID=A0A060PY93_9ALPH|nr:nuclear protein UL24 [Pteropodid alphaherpesvirus 1]BAP00703.1 nuclear protein UL24 [Pteropodid alphaherpesvirus 1]
MSKKTTSVVDRRKILRAGERSHTRFYAVLAKEVREFNETKICGRLLMMMSKSLQGRSMFEARRVSLICEVDLGARRPDCICIFEFSNPDSGGGVCIILELKTCRFISSGETASKREQRATGMHQLRDSLKLLQPLAPPGNQDIYLCPILVFIAQKTLRVSRVTRLVPLKIAGDISAMNRALASLSTYTVPIKPRKRRVPSVRKRQSRKNGATLKQGLPPLTSPTLPDETSAATSVVVAGARNTTVLQKIASLFCVPMPHLKTD